MAQSCINIFVPPISSFPELSSGGGGGGGYALKDRIQVLPKANAMAAEGVMAVAMATGGAGGVTEGLGEQELHYLYVIDSQGRLLEHMRYTGDDYRAALRESFAKDGSAFKPNLTREPSCSSESGVALIKN